MAKRRPLKRWKLSRLDFRPYCRVHGERMVCGHTGEWKRYYYCTEAGCKESKSVPRPGAAALASLKGLVANERERVQSPESRVQSPEAEEERA